MVHAIDNRSVVEAEIEDISRNDAKGESILRVRITSVRSVEKYANLLRDTEGKQIDMHLHDEESDAGYDPGDRVRCTVRMVGPGRYIVVPGSCVRV